MAGMRPLQSSQVLKIQPQHFYLLVYKQLIPKNAEQQKKFDAMSGSWEGIKASEAAANTVFKHEFAPVPTTYTK